MSHALQKKGGWAVGNGSLPDDITRANNFFRRMGDQIEMIQYIGGRIGEDRDAILDMNHRPDLLPEDWPPSALSKGKGRALNVASKCGSEPAPKRAKTSRVMEQRSQSTVIDKEPFSPVMESDRGFSDTPEDE
jgi:hypothetical protein